MHSSIHFLIAMTLFSAVTAVWAYSRARALHFRIEDRFPGFNDLMRGHVKWHRKR